MTTHKRKALNKKQLKLIDDEKQSFIEAYAEKMNYRLPSQLLMDMANDSETPNREVVQACISLLPYTESKLPTKVDHSGEIEHNHTHLHTEALDKFDDFMQLNNDDVLEGEVVQDEHSTTEQ